MSYLEGLTPSQYRAATSRSGFLVTNAGPGAGKTAALVARYETLLKHAPPREISVYAFSREAAKEIRKRISPLLSGRTHQEIANLPIGTLHSQALRIVTAYRISQGLRPLKMLSEDVTITTLHRALVDYADADHARWNRLRDSLGGRVGISPVAGRIANLLSILSLEQITNPQSIRPYVRSDEAAHMVAAVAAAWQRNWEGASVYDNAAIISHAATTIENEPNHPALPAPRFMLVDEGQDLTVQQWRFLDRLGRRARSVAIFGDPDQGIFSWRGACTMPDATGYPEMSYSRHLLDIRPESVTFTESFRCPGSVLAPAIRLVNRNHPWAPKDFTSEKNGHALAIGLPVGEHLHAVSEVVGSLSSGAPAGVAILARRQDSLRNISFALLERQIPVRLLRADKDIDNRLAADLSMWTRLARAPGDRSIFVQSLQMHLFPGIGEATAAKLLAKAKRGGNAVTLLRGLAAQKGERGIPKRVLSHTADQIEYLSRGIVSKRLDHWFDDLNRCVGMLEKIGDNLDSTRVAELMEAWRYFLRAGEACGTPERFIQAFASGESQDAVTLGTFHAAKGLEWDFVFLLGCGAHDLELSAAKLQEPLLAAGVCDGGPEEERRLLHVAMTRAKKFMTMTWDGERGHASSYLVEAGIECLAMNGSVFVETCRRLTACERHIRPAQETAQLNLF